ncbi:DUF3857 domain-containing protein [Pontibacter sp. 172403-2]|uniref:DUF3857 domain-containing protein n=1 Tax=Pontibacter rufus TaxID=2791028 RepID=UPI0018AFFE93|nr:DUF3857 domain-containing protein [Pontibacter sp. 172403-2]MBF9253112.1 DUF3857 domain-containing protein [Pontibacter sp. 172403-2]
MEESYPLQKINFVYTLLLLLGLLWQQTALAAPRQVGIAPEPAWVKKLPLRTETNINPEHVNGGSLTLLQDTQFEVAREERYFHYIYKITSEEGVQNNSEIRFTFDPNYEKLLCHKVIVWRNGKPINKLNLNKIKVLQREEGMERYIYDDNLTAVLVLDDIRVGDVIEYACTLKGSNPVFKSKFFNSFNLQGYDPMDELLVYIVMPQERKINYKLYRTKQKPVIAQANGNITYTWHLKNLPATEVDAETPSWFDPYPGVYLSEFRSWEEVAQWALPMYSLNENPGKALQARIDSIMSANGSDEARLEATLRFVQDEVRYLGLEAGIGGFKPRPPSVVFSQRLGDCKDKALLLSSMLHQMGIEAYPALVNSTYGKEIQHFLPSPGAFNHCIVQVKLLGGKTYWYDATLSKQRGNYKNIYLPNYGKALVLAPQTKSLANVTSSTIEVPQVQVHEVFYIDSLQGPVKLEVRTDYRDSQADYQRSHFASNSLQDIEKDYLNFYAKNYPEIEAMADVSYQDEEENNVFTVIEKYSISNFWEKQKDNSKIIACGFYPQVMQGYLSRPQISKRTMPLALNYPLHIEEKMTILLPSAWPIDNATEEIKDDAFTFTKDVAYSHSGKELVVTYTYQSHQDYVEAKATPAYLRNLNDMLDQMGYGLTYDESVAGNGNAGSGNFSWSAFAFAILAFCAAAFGAYKLYCWDPQPAPGFSVLDKESIGGWLALVAIGLISSPIRIISTIATNNYFDKSTWSAMLDAGSAAYSSGLAVIIVLEIAVNMALLAFSLLLIYLFFKRRTSIPKLMILFYGFNFVFIVAEYAALAMLRIPLGNETNSTSDVLKALVPVIIWIPYFYHSQRVKATFVEQLNPAPLVLEEDAVELESKDILA